MSRNPVSLADLLTAIAQAAPNEKAEAALSVGYRQRDAKGNRDTAQPLPALKPPKTELAPDPEADPKADTDRHPKPQPTSAEVEPVAPHFWRMLAVQDHSPAPSEAQGWLTSLQPSTADFVSDLRVPLPASKPLVSPARAAVALRRILAARSPGRRVDIARAVNLIATAGTFRRLPMQALSRWPATLQVLVDNSERLRPLTRDYAPWLSAMQKTLRSRMRLRQVRGLPVETDAAGRPRLPVVLDGSTVLVLGDVGLYGDAGAALYWSALSRRVRDAGGRTLVLAPMPASMHPVTAQAGT